MNAEERPDDRKQRKCYWCKEIIYEKEVGVEPFVDQNKATRYKWSIQLQNECGTPHTCRQDMEE